MYGLKQAGHEWYKTLEKILEIAGLKRYIGDEGTYVNNSGDIIIGTHVDDLVGIAPQDKDLDGIEASCEKSVELEKRGIPQKILGMETTWNQEKSEVILKQKSLIETMNTTYLLAEIQDPGKSGKRPSLPLDKEFFNPPNQDESLGDPGKRKFQAIVGGLLFLNRMTRLDISIQVNLLGRRSSNPSRANLTAALATLKYLWQTKSGGIILCKPRELNLVVYADASYGGETSRLQSGVLLTLGDQPVGWYSRRQDVVALSITEAEYIADCEGAKDIAWTQQLLQELKVKIETPILKTDSEGAYNLSQTAKFLRRSRHIQHRYHYIRQQAQNKAQMIVTIPGKENLADHLTKLIPMSTIRAWKELWMASSGKSSS